MIKKVLISLSIVLGILSGYVLIGKCGVSTRNWILLSFAPYMLIAGLSLLIKSNLLQSVVVPFLLFYGAGLILNTKWILENIYSHISGVFMLVMAVYIILTKMIKLKFIRTVLGMVVGVILFAAIKYYRVNYISKKDLKSVPILENRLLYFLYNK